VAAQAADIEALASALQSAVAGKLA
jgi:hypothetical protein